ncbi:hypothetical protein CYV19_01355 [Natronobacterium gregoryi SP2]|uniref:Uncharacterized protein n=1 Tax=Natronobacterium gregoryi (strain ATCC 43098 / DSM 3393 / CCM 3738 / CIP 104747 / IAM 13177 / JCM 8860 / NBRC 102187 / NCIMB 2189 / SP2) TaxID=797304 RepID=L9XQ20_NATGS|nr:hypothetical protein C490_15117 [Natronobacterium gregoryi SP2]PLK22067.1 hypothetical protein CYV19_01355 [Natronobacterium gregoryi SP2]
MTVSLEFENEEDDRITASTTSESASRVVDRTAVTVSRMCSRCGSALAIAVDPVPTGVSTATTTDRGNIQYPTCRLNHT